MLYFEHAGIRYAITDLDPAEFDRLISRMRDHYENGVVGGYPFYRRGSSGTTVFPLPHKDIRLIEE